MSGLIESATAILSVCERRLEVAAHNVANISTPGYKRQLSFSKMVEGGPASVAANMVADAGLAVRRDFAQGALGSTGNPLDLAISGTGLFQLRGPDGMLYSRQGQFRLGADGTVVTPQGYALQQAGGGDLVLDNAAVSILEDGTVLDAGVPVGKIGVFRADDTAALVPVGEAHFAVAGDGLEASTDAVVRQGMIENSNVSVGDEMVSTMSVLRHSEMGARLVQVYDDLLGRAITSLGQGGR
jgi:flagellar basal-body rod protein FlgF